MGDNKKSVIYGALAVLSWSTVATAFKIAGEHMTPFTMVLVSTVTSFLVLTIILTIQGTIKKLSALTSRQWGILALVGFINPVAYYLILFMAYALLPAQVAQPLNYTWPIILLVLLALFTHQKISSIKYIGMTLSLAGVACISIGGKSIEGELSVYGILLALLSALLWASYWLMNKKLCAEIDSTISFFGTFLFGSVYLLGASLFIGIDLLTMPALLSGAYIGCFEMAIPFMLFGQALRITSNPTLINQMCYLSPFLSLFFIATILGEPIAVTTYIGLILIVGGLIFNETVKAPIRLRRSAT